MAILVIGPRHVRVATQCGLLDVQPLALALHIIRVTHRLKQRAVPCAESRVSTHESLQEIFTLLIRGEGPLAPPVLEIGALAARLVEPQMTLLVELDARGRWPRF